MTLASRGVNAAHLEKQLKTALAGNGGSDEGAARLAKIFADLDHKLRADVDAAVDRLESRIEEGLRELTEAEL